MTNINLPTLSQEEIDIAKSFYASGMSIREISQDRNLSYTAVYFFVIHNGKGDPGNNLPVLDKSQIQEIISLHKAGYSQHKLAVLFNVSDTTIYKVIHGKYGKSMG